MCLTSTCSFNAHTNPMRQYLRCTHVRTEVHQVKSCPGLLSWVASYSTLMVSSCQMACNLPFISQSPRFFKALLIRIYAVQRVFRKISLRRLNTHSKNFSSHRCGKWTRGQLYTAVSMPTWISTKPLAVVHSRQPIVPHVLLELGYCIKRMC